MDYYQKKNAGIREYAQYLRDQRMKNIKFDEAARKEEAVRFFLKYGLRATMDGFSVSRGSIYGWKEKLEKNNWDRNCLVSKSRAPWRKRERVVDGDILDFIVGMRRKYPRLGKDKIQALLREAGLPQISVSTVGRLIADLKRGGRIAKHVRVSYYAKSDRFVERKPVKREKVRRKGYCPEKPGDLMQADTVVKFVNGLRKHIVTAIDMSTGFAFAHGYKGHSSATTRDFFLKLETVAPFKIQRVQTDNGSEFLHRFHDELDKKNIVHFWNYPRRPTQNARIERFNRTIQEEFVDYHLHELAHDIDRFNHLLMEWLIWYNTRRPHHSLNLKSPINYLISNYGFSKMLGTYTVG